MNMLTINSFIVVSILIGAVINLIVTKVNFLILTLSEWQKRRKEQRGRTLMILFTRYFKAQFIIIERRIQGKSGWETNGHQAQNGDVQDRHE